MLGRALLLLLLATAAQAQTVQTGLYLPQTTPAAAHTRSAQQCVALGCKSGTTEWWSVTPLFDGTAAIVLHATGPYSATYAMPIGGKTGGLTILEQAAVVTSVTVASSIDLSPAVAK